MRRQEGGREIRGDNGGKWEDVKERGGVGEQGRRRTQVSGPVIIISCGGGTRGNVTEVHWRHLRTNGLIYFTLFLLEKVIRLKP